MKTFRLSQRYVDNLYWVTVVSGALLCCMWVLWSFMGLDFDLERFSYFVSLNPPLLAISTLLMFSFFLVGGYYTRQDLKQKYRLVLDPKNLVLLTGYARTESAWRDIGKVKILTNAKGRPITIKVWSTSFSRPLRLAGLEDMPALVRTISSRLPSGAPIETGRNRLNWDIPWLALAPLVGGVVVIAAMEISLRFGWSEFEFLGTLLLIWAVVLYRFKRPISKADPSYATWEVMIAAHFLIGVAFLLWG